MSRRITAFVALVVVALVACGRDAPITDNASAALRARAAEIRDLANARRPADVAVKLQELRSAVAAFQKSGDIDEARAREVVAAADAVAQQLPLITTTTTTTTQPPKPPRIDGEERNKDRRDKDEDGD